jgi:hypothetical protein
MELDQRFMIPTASRAKISHKLSYPFGAERVSVVLASVPQHAEVRLHFYSGFDIQLPRPIRVPSCGVSKQRTAITRVAHFESI